MLSALQEDEASVKRYHHHSLPHDRPKSLQNFLSLKRAPGDYLHLLPGLIACHFEVVVPDTIARVPCAHGVDHGRAAQSRASRVVDTQEGGAVGSAGIADPELALGRLPCQMAVLEVPRVSLGVVLDPEVPRDGRGVLAEAHARVGIASLDQEDRVSGLREIGRHGSATRTTSDNDVVVLRRSHFFCRSRIGFPTTWR